jgi:hypothetical protein
MYAGAGAADITNWARGVLVLDPTSARGVFKLIAAKRGSRIGWEDLLGRKQDIRYFSWVEKGIAWREATPEEIRDCNKKQENEKAGPDQLLELVPKTGTIAKNDLEKKADAELGIKRDKFRALVNELVEDGELFVHKIKRHEMRDEIHLSRHRPETENDAL